MGLCHDRRAAIATEVTALHIARGTFDLKSFGFTLRELQASRRNPHYGGAVRSCLLLTVRAVANYNAQRLLIYAVSNCTTEAAAFKRERHLFLPVYFK